MEGEKEKVVPTERELQGFNLNDLATIELIHHAQQSDEADRLLTVRQALKKYKKAVFWAMILSTSLVMEGYDLVIVCNLLFPTQLLTSVTQSNHTSSQINSFYGQTQFRQRFGIYHPASNKKLIPAEWQSGLSNSAVVGQLAGLMINAYTQDRFGCRVTMMGFMVWMAAAIFIPVFAPSLSVLAFGEAMCGMCRTFCFGMTQTA